MAQISTMSTWTDALTLNTDNTIQSGSEEALASSLRRGADLRLYLEFKHDEHLQPGSDIKDIVQDVVDLRVTYLLDDAWSVGIMTQKLPMNMPHGWGPRESVSFFLCNQNNLQCSGRPFLDGKHATGSFGPSPLPCNANMPKIHYGAAADAETNAPSYSFIYDYEVTRFIVNDVWQEIFAHDDQGNTTFGSRDDLVEAFAQGCEIKVGISGLCSDLLEDPGQAIDHEVFVHAGASYNYPHYPNGEGCFMTCTQPVVRAKPQIPMEYESRAWDFGWIMPRTDGTVFRWLVDPYTLKFHKSEGQYPVRWFVR